jgi:hypothetical protein
MNSSFFDLVAAAFLGSLLSATILTWWEDKIYEDQAQKDEDESL